MVGVGSITNYFLAPLSSHLAFGGVLWADEGCMKETASFNTREHCSSCFLEQSWAPATSCSNTIAKACAIVCEICMLAIALATSSEHLPLDSRLSHSHLKGNMSTEMFTISLFWKNKSFDRHEIIAWLHKYRSIWLQIVHTVIYWINKRLPCEHFLDDRIECIPTIKCRACSHRHTHTLVELFCAAIHIIIVFNAWIKCTE